MIKRLCFSFPISVVPFLPNCPPNTKGHQIPPPSPLLPHPHPMPRHSITLRKAREQYYWPTSIPLPVNTPVQTSFILSYEFFLFCFLISYVSSFCFQFQNLSTQSFLEKYCKFSIKSKKLS